MTGHRRRIGGLDDIVLVAAIVNTIVNPSPLAGLVAITVIIHRHHRHHPPPPRRHPMRKKHRDGRVTARQYTYVGRVSRGAELGVDMVTLAVYRDADVIHLADGDEFVTFATTVPLFRDGKLEGGPQ